MPWQVKFEAEAGRDLSKLSRDIQVRIIEKLDWLEENFEAVTPLPLGAKWQGRFKLRVGDWRIIYRLNWEALLIIIEVIDRRDRIYKR